MLQAQPRRCECGSVSQRQAPDARRIRPHSPPPTPHKFRRAHAITMLRQGVDLITLSRLMGHTSLAVLERYLKQVSDDLQEAHRRAGPVDNSELWRK